MLASTESAQIEMMRSDVIIRDTTVAFIPFLMKLNVICLGKTDSLDSIFLLVFLNDFPKNVILHYASDIVFGDLFQERWEILVPESF